LLMIAARVCVRIRDGWSATGRAELVGCFV
jgi:hypothetical protein